MKERVGGILVDEDLMFIHLLSGLDEPDWAGTVLSKFATRGLCINFITESPDSRGRANMSVTVRPDDEYALEMVLDDIREIHREIVIKKIEPVSLVTVYGPHFKERSGLAARGFRALGLHGINILGISTSISSISCVILQDQLASARSALGSVFELP